VTLAEAVREIDEVSDGVAVPVLDGVEVSVSEELGEVEAVLVAVPVEDAVLVAVPVEDAVLVAVNDELAVGKAVTVAEKEGIVELQRRIWGAGSVKLNV
jgi:hypothetical protein